MLYILPPHNGILTTKISLGGECGKMAYLTLVDFTQIPVTNSKMLQKGGGVAQGRYTRRAKNIVVSPGLIARNEWAAEHMRESCSLDNKCIPTGMNSAAVGQPVPGSPGKLYTNCTDAERATRLENARTCAKSTLATKGGIYGAA